MRRALAALALFGLLAAVGCSSESGDQPPGPTPAVGPSSVNPSGPSPPAASPSGATPGADRPGNDPSDPEASENGTPRPVGKDQQFALDEVAEFDDGLQIEIAGTTADRAKPKDRGAEATDGQIVIASVRIENNSEDEFFAGDVLIRATYGNGSDAQIIIDPTNQLRDGFDGTVKKNDELVAPVGFAIPVAALGKVTFIVDCNDDIHDPVSFTGRIERS